MDTKQMKKDLLNTTRKSAVELPADYWKIILNLLDELCAQRMDELIGTPNIYVQMLQMKDPSELTQLSGPLLARALIVDKLVEDGILQEKAREVAGLGWLAKGIEEQQAGEMN